MPYGVQYSRSTGRCSHLAHRDQIAAVHVAGEQHGGANNHRRSLPAADSRHVVHILPAAGIRPVGTAGHILLHSLADNHLGCSRSHHRHLGGRTRDRGILTCLFGEAGGLSATDGFGQSFSGGIALSRHQ